MNDLNQKKRIIYFSLAAVILIAIGYLIWRTFIRSSEPAQPTRQPPITGSVPGFPPGATGTSPVPSTGTTTPQVVTLPSEARKLLRLTDYPIVGPSFNPDGTRILFYKKEGGGLYAVDFDGKSADKLAPITIVGLLDAAWSSSGDRSVVSYLDQDTVKSFLHIGASSVGVLPPGARSPAWSPDRRSLAYLITRDGITNLIISDAAGRNPRTVFSNQLRDASITWVTANKLSFLTAPSGRAEGFLFTYTPGSGSLIQILGPRFGLTARWSPDGSKILASFTNRAGNNPQLALFDASGKELQRLAFATLPDKCAWSSDSQDIYCAIPRQVSPGTTWPDDYLRGELASPDRIVDINPANGDVTPVIDEEQVTVSNILISKDKSLLLFVNRADGTLWRYKLKE